jgi:sulfur carrier protein
MAELRAAPAELREPNSVSTATSREGATSMSIVVNGERQDVPRPCTIAQLLATLDMGDRRVAVAVNGEVVPRGAHVRATVSQDDHVEILEAVGGG